MKLILFNNYVVNYEKVNYFILQSKHETSYDQDQLIIFDYGNSNGNESRAYIKYKDYKEAKKVFVYIQNAILSLQGIHPFEDDFYDDLNIQTTNDDGWIIDMRKISDLISANNELAMTEEDLIDVRNELESEIKNLKNQTKKLKKELKEAEAMNGLTISEANEKEGLLSMAKKIKKKRKKSLSGYQPDYDIFDELSPLDGSGISAHELSLLTHDFPPQGGSGVPKK